MYTADLGGLKEDLKTRLEILKEGAVQDLLTSVWSKLGDKIQQLSASATPAPAGAGEGIPVRVQLPEVRQLLPQAALIFAVLMIPALVGARSSEGFQRRRRRRSR